ncbi:MAG: peptidylprolyl isomerase [Bryobacteraceae bacterium]
MSVSLLGLAVCAQTPAAQSPAKAAAKKAPAKQAAPAVPKTPRPDGLYTTLSTSLGDITLKLFEDQAPVTVKNFLGLATGRKSWVDPKTQQRVSRPLYNGLTFHRVIPGFMIQGGDPTGTGMGGTDVIVDEFDPALTFDQPGRLAMANAGPHTGSCQFFITDSGPRLPIHLNGKHTIFGQVVEHQDVVGQIARVPRNVKDKPNVPVVIKKVSFERWKDGKEAPVFPPAATKAGAAKKGASAAAKKATTAPAK